jgi:hypothetical protein
MTDARASHINAKQGTIKALNTLNQGQQNKALKRRIIVKHTSNITHHPTQHCKVLDSILKRKKLKREEENNLWRK